MDGHRVSLSAQNALSVMFWLVAQSAQISNNNSFKRFSGEQKHKLHIVKDKHHFLRCTKTTLTGICLHILVVSLKDYVVMGFGA